MPTLSASLIGEFVSILLVVPLRRSVAWICHILCKVFTPNTARNLDDRFESRVLPLFKRHAQQVRDLIPELYLHGLASGDSELALSRLLGEGAPLSASLQQLSLPRAH